MPEGDAVRRSAARLDRALAGQTLVSADLRVPRFATVDLTGGLVLGTHVHGKHLFTRIRGELHLTLHTHLRMDGRWLTGPAGMRAGPVWQIRVLLANRTSQAVGLRLGIVEVLPTEREHRITDRLGPDILGEMFDASTTAARIREQADRPLVETLLDQSVASGLGTIWAAETAFAARANPWTACAETDLAEALEQTRTRMRRAVAAQGRADDPAYRVYGRTGQPCRACGHLIRTGRVGVPPTDRVTYWCPSCQPQSRRPGASELSIG
jgi:endonuclease-8